MPTVHGDQRDRDTGDSDAGVSDTGESGRFASAPSADRSTGATCSMCGRWVDSPPLTWMRETGARRGAVWVCQDCARTHLRSIESKLDQTWW